MTLTLADQERMDWLFPADAGAFYGKSMVEQAHEDMEMLVSAIEEMGKRHRPGVRWQFKNGSLAPIRRDMDLSSMQLYSAWDRSLGCEVLYDVESRRGRRAA